MRNNTSKSTDWQRSGQAKIWISNYSMWSDNKQYEQWRPRSIQQPLYLLVWGWLLRPMH